MTAMEDSARMFDSRATVRIVRRIALAIGLIGAAAWLAQDRIGGSFTGVDDANIFFVYARNLASGHGVVFSGTERPTEGISSLLWLAICSCAFLVRRNPEMLLLGVNIVL